MQRKILVTLAVLAAGLVMLLGYDSRAGEMLQNTIGNLDFHSHVSRFIPAAFSLLSEEQVGIILMIVVCTMATIFFRGRDPYKS